MKEYDEYFEFTSSEIRPMLEQCLVAIAAHLDARDYANVLAGAHMMATILVATIDEDATRDLMDLIAPCCEELARRQRALRARRAADN